MEGGVGCCSKGAKHTCIQRGIWVFMAEARKPPQAGQGECDPRHLTCLCSEARSMWDPGPAPSSLGLPCAHYTHGRCSLGISAFALWSCIFPDLPPSVQAESPCHPCPGHQREKETPRGRGHVLHAREWAGRTGLCVPITQGPRLGKYRCHKRWAGVAY